MKAIRVVIAPITITFFASACVGTDLNVPSSHPGSADARVGRLPELTALRSDFNAAVSAPSGGEGHEHGARAPSAAPPAASDADDGAASHQRVGGASEAAQGAADAPSAARYTCPMHPEVDRAGPGQCPKCGMKLVPKKEKK